jgi:hypothetical protein
MENTEWVTEGYPQEEGDFLWVAMWSCDCCVRKSGVAFIFDVDDTAPRIPVIHYTTATGRHLGISWEGQEPDFLDVEKTKPDVDGWMAIPTLPDSKQ